jgi:hypothetical protein
MMTEEKYKGFGGWLILFAIFLALFFPFDPVRGPLVPVFQDVGASEDDLRAL